MNINNSLDRTKLLSAFKSKSLLFCFGLLVDIGVGFNGMTNKKLGIFLPAGGTPYATF